MLKIIKAKVLLHKQRLFLSILDKVCARSSIALSEGQREEVLAKLIHQTDQLPFPFKLMDILLVPEVNFDQTLQIWSGEKKHAPKLKTLLGSVFYGIFNYYLFLVTFAVYEYE